MTSRRSWLSVWTLVLVGAAEAQEPVQGTLLGQRIRITTFSSRDRRLIGTVAEQDGTKLVVSNKKGALTTIATSDVARLEVSAGKKSNALLGALIGAGAGLGLGLWYVATECSESSCSRIASGLLILGAGGAGLGAVIGDPIKTEHWRPVPAPHPSSSQLPGYAALRLSMTVRF